MLIFPILVFGGSCLFCQLWVQVMSMSCPSVLGGVSQSPLGSWWLLRLVTSFKLSSMHFTNDSSVFQWRKSPRPPASLHTPDLISNFLPISTTTEQQLKSVKVWKHHQVKSPWRLDQELQSSENKSLAPSLRSDPSDVWALCCQSRKQKKENWPNRSCWVAQQI